MPSLAIATRGYVDSSAQTRQICKICKLAKTSREVPNCQKQDEIACGDCVVRPKIRKVEERRRDATQMRQTQNPSSIACGDVAPGSLPGDNPYRFID